MEKLCQCPISGGVHFYETVSQERKTDFYACQCPISGGVHFYMMSQLLDGDPDLIVSMPYIWRRSFLPDREHNDTTRAFPVSMPYIGRRSFLQS